MSACSPIRSNIVSETTRFELQLSTVVAAKARPFMAVGKISLSTNQPTIEYSNDSRVMTVKDLY